MKNSEMVCFNCAYCSMSYPSMIETCDRDEKRIRDVYTENCPNFVEVEDEEEICRF